MNCLTTFTRASAIMYFTIQIVLLSASCSLFYLWCVHIIQLWVLAHYSSVVFLSTPSCLEVISRLLIQLLTSLLSLFSYCWIYPKYFYLHVLFFTSLERFVVTNLHFYFPAVVHGSFGDPVSQLENPARSFLSLEFKCLFLLYYSWM